jgi:hypothetical protein
MNYVRFYAPSRTKLHKCLSAQNVSNKMIYTLRAMYVFYNSCDFWGVIKQRALYLHSEFVVAANSSEFRNLQDDHRNVSN